MSGTPRGDTRPLSPHLQVWRFHATMAASIMHRMTGAALYGGAFLIAAWLIALATGEQAYLAIEAVIFSLPGQALLFLWTAAVLFHLANGIRHLLWDGPGFGFSPRTASMISVFNFAFALFGAGAIMFAAAQY